MIKSDLGKKRLILFTTQDFPEKVREGNQGRNMVAGAEAEVMEKYFLLTCSTWLALPVFLYNQGPVA